MLLRPFTLLATSVFASVTVLAQPAMAKPKVAVLGLEVVGDSAMDQKATEAAKTLSRELRREAGRFDGPFDLAPNSSRDLLEMKLLNDCSDEGRRCMAEIGRQLGAERLVYGKMERTRRGYTVVLRLLDTANAELLKQFSDVIPDGDAVAAGGMQRHARSLYGELIGVETEGALSITASAERGTVYVDGQIRTSLSAGSARVSGLTVGVHTIAIEAVGFARFETQISIAPGETRNLRANLIALENKASDVGAKGGATGDRPGRGWRIAFWSGALATAGAGAGWVYSGFTVQSEEKAVAEATEAYMGPPLEGVEGDTYPDACASFSDEALAQAEDQYRSQIAAVQRHCERGDKHRDLVNWVWIPATATAAVFTVFAGYKGYLAANKSSPERDMARKRRTGSRVTVTPALGPTLVGAGLELQF